MPLFAPEAPAAAPAPPHPALGALRGADLDNLTPLQAFDLLRRLKDQASTEDTDA
jgi:hypothetical protein